jgi:choline dehydrogenase
LSYDFIVVGSGSAGAIVATRLSEDPNTSVLLIESGPMYENMEDLPPHIRGNSKNTFATKDWWSTNPKEGRMFVARANDNQAPMLVPRGNTLGGSSSVNAQIFLRGEPDDYDSWAAMGNDEWDFKSCLPYFAKLENDLDFSGDFHGNSGPVQCKRHPRDRWQQNQEAFYQGCVDLGFNEVLDHNDPDSTGIGPIPFNTVDGIRQSTWLTYLRPNMDRPNLSISPDTLVRSLNFENSRAIGITVEKDGNIETISGNEIILSAGAISTPQLLLLSGIGDKADLDKLGIQTVKNLPGVGKNLRDHPLISVVWKKSDVHEIDSSLTGLQVALRYTASNSDLRNDMYIHPVSTSNPRASYGDNNRWIFAYEDFNNHLGMTVSLYLAKSQGSLTLRSKDPKIQPYLNYNLLEDEEDLRRVREAVELCISIGEGPTYKGITSERVKPPENALSCKESLDRWLKETVRTSHHVSGTCKMGPESEAMAVVNQHGKVHGIEGLRIADASIMPDCIRANTNVATMMIGEKISDLVKNQS